MCLSFPVFCKKGQRNNNSSGDGRRFEQLREKGFCFRFRAVPEDSGKDTRKKGCSIFHNVFGIEMKMDYCNALYP